jgi:hypothetical protein
MNEATRAAGEGSRRPEPGLGQIVIDDLRKTRLDRSWLRELRELYRFYVDDETRRELAGMGRLRRAFWLLGWLLKSLLLKLSPGRRLMLLIALLLAALGPTEIRLIGPVATDLRPWGFVLLLIILMLELKDKLLARSEIEVARQVQLALLPQEQPKLAGWSVWTYTRPANDVGGDLVDYVDFGTGRVGLALADVAGKGLGAALLTAKLQATLRALVPECESLDELGNRLNTILCRDGLDNRYATLFYFELEESDGRVRYLNAGHNPACVIGPDRSELLRPTSRPLGMMESTSYGEGRIELRPGESLLVYSDGLTEAANAAEEEFGAARLQSLLPGLRHLPPDRAGARVLEEVDRFVGEQRMGDDLSLVIVRRLP